MWSFMSMTINNQYSHNDDLGVKNMLALILSASKRIAALQPYCEGRGTYYGEYSICGDINH